MLSSNQKVVKVGDKVACRECLRKGYVYWTDGTARVCAPCGGSGYVTIIENK